MEKMDGKTMDIVAENVGKLKELFPEAFTEDGSYGTAKDAKDTKKIDFEVLKELLGEYVTDRDERYSFTWNGKSKARMIAQTPSTGTLRPCKEESVDWDSTQNIFIEGDNLEVLKLLQKSYHKKVKMIYIDPPYNTGKDFVYKDNFKDNIKNYKEITGQVDGEGRNLSNNPETSGRYHTDWLNMMYPRLKLARNLLKDDGVIFISIDENEFINLKKICDEIFGEESFVETIVWKRRANTPNDRVIGKIHEYVLVYSKSPDKLDIYLQPRDSKIDKKYKNPNNDPRGPWFPDNLSANGKGGRLTQSCIYPILNPSKNKEYYPPMNKCWLYGKERMAELIADDRIGFRQSSGAPYLKRFLSEVRQGSTLPSLILDGGFSVDSAKEIKSLFSKDVSEFPKPTKLLKKLITTGIAKNDNDIVLDFFAGSGTTADSTLQLNAEDGGNRHFVLVQLPESCDEKSEAYKAGYKTIAEISKERIRRAGKKVISDQWEVISKEEKIRYGCKTLSRTDCMAKGNGVSQSRLFSSQETSKGGTLQPVRSDEESGSIHSIEHSRGAVSQFDERVSSVSGNSERVESGTGNSTALMRESGLPCQYGYFGSDAALTGDREDGVCSFAKTVHCPLVTKYCPDTGFRVFKLDSTNIKPWEMDFDMTEGDLWDQVENIKPDRSEEDVLFEILLKYGLSLDLPIEKWRVESSELRMVNSELENEEKTLISTFSTLYSIGFCALVICLDDNITLETVEAITKLKEKQKPEVMRVVFKDSGFKDDVVKTNAVQILGQAGINDVRSL